MVETPEKYRSQYIPKRLIPILKAKGYTIVNRRGFESPAQVGSAKFLLRAYPQLCKTDANAGKRFCQWDMSGIGGPEWVAHWGYTTHSGPIRNLFTSRATRVKFSFTRRFDDPSHRSENIFSTQTEEHEFPRAAYRDFLSVIEDHVPECY